MAFAGMLYFQPENEAPMATDDEPVDEANAAAFRQLLDRAVA